MSHPFYSAVGLSSPAARPSETTTEFVRYCVFVDGREVASGWARLVALGDGDESENDVWEEPSEPAGSPHPFWPQSPSVWLWASAF